MYLLYLQHVFNETKIKFGKRIMEHFTDTVMYEIELTSKYIKHMSNELFKKLGFDITPEEYAALDTINVHQNICQRDLAKLILKDRAGTGRIIVSLEEKKLIERYADTKGNRLVRKMKITEKGINVLNSVYTIIKEVGLIPFEKYFSEDDRQNLKDILQKFRKVIAEHIEIKI